MIRGTNGVSSSIVFASIVIQFLLGPEPFDVSEHVQKGT